MPGPGVVVSVAPDVAPARILVIDDDVAVRRTVVEMLARSGYEPFEAATPSQALALLGDPGLRLVISDIVMPGLSGFELTEAVRQKRPSIPVLLITGAGTEANLSEALARGAAGLIAKPFSMGQLQGTVEAVLRRAERTEQDVRQRFVPTVLAGVLGSVLEARDGSVRGHCDRLTFLAERLAGRLGLGAQEVEAISLGALLHDIGKIGIPDSILLKPGPLDENEWAVMRAHADIGDRMLAQFSELVEVREVVRHHHERWDGTGYPAGLRGEAIPIGARIVSVADAIEAMSVRRPYRDALGPEEIVRQLENGRGSQWDPVVVDCALELVLLGGLVFGADGATLVPIGRASVHTKDELGHFVDARLADLVRMVIDLDADQIAAAERAGLGGNGNIAVGRRQEALAVLSSLKAAIAAAERHP